MQWTPAVRFNIFFFFFSVGCPGTGRVEIIYDEEIDETLRFTNVKYAELGRRMRVSKDG